MKKEVGRLGDSVLKIARMSEVAMPSLMQHVAKLVEIGKAMEKDVDEEIQKQQQKAWPDRNIKNKNLLVGDLALLYNSRVKDKPKKLHIEWMGPYVVEEIHTNGSV